jgi:plasmid maintenance system antidote protein VapI
MRVSIRANETGVSMPRSDEPQPPIGDILRKQRVEVLGKGLREAASLLQIAPAHLTDIEKGRRNPSEELLLRITKLYRIDEAKLRSGWSRPETIVA